MDGQQRVRKRENEYKSALRKSPERGKATNGGRFRKREGEQVLESKKSSSKSTMRGRTIRDICQLTAKTHYSQQNSYMYNRD